MKHRGLPYLAALVAGIILGFGVAVSAVLDPGKIKEFLDLAAVDDGDWNANLLFVIGASALVTMTAMRLRRRLRYSPPEAGLTTLTPNRIDRSLIGGSAVFGIGCGISGLSPETALANLASPSANVWIFIATMALGSFGVYGLRRQRNIRKGQDQ